MGERTPRPDPLCAGGPGTPGGERGADEVGRGHGKILLKQESVTVSTKVSLYAIQWSASKWCLPV